MFWYLESISAPFSMHSLAKSSLFIAQMPIKPDIPNALGIFTSAPCSMRYFAILSVSSVLNDWNAIIIGVSSYATCPLISAPASIIASIISTLPIWTEYANGLFIAYGCAGGSSSTPLLSSSLTLATSWFCIASSNSSAGPLLLHELKITQNTVSKAIIVKFFLFILNPLFRRCCFMRVRLILSFFLWFVFVLFLDFCPCVSEVQGSVEY